MSHNNFRAAIMDGDYDVAQEKLGRLVQQHGVEVGDCWMANETHTRIYI